MFGEHELKTKFIKILDRRIHLVEESGGRVLYRRDDVRVIIPGGDGGFRVLPAPASGYGVEFLMIKLSRKIAVPPKATISGYLSAPIDVEVKAGDLTIDRFVVGREKYALYGQDSMGVIARYHISDFTGEEPDSLGVMKLVIENPSDRWRMVEKVVVPIGGSAMFYSEERAYYPLVILTTKGIYEVNNTGNPPDGRLKATRTAEPIPNFRMRWG
ncbi:DUF432 domain-containing protein [Thermococcus sp.]